MDRKLATQDFYFIWQTPLKFLLKDRIDLTRDVLVSGRDQRSGQWSRSRSSTRRPSAAPHASKLMFDPATFALKQWEVTDPQGNETLVSLFNVDRNTPPDPSVFQIHANRLDGSSSRFMNQN